MVDSRIDFSLEKADPPEVSEQQRLDLEWGLLGTSADHRGPGDSQCQLMEIVLTGEWREGQGAPCISKTVPTDQKLWP